MSIPVIEIPRELRNSLEDYRSIFTKPQFKHFQKLIAGLIVSDNKTIQEINDCFSENDQSSLNRFVNFSDWDEDELEKIRIKQIKKINPSKGILIIDPSLLHKTGKHMEKANYHYSGITKKKEWGHMLVNSFFTDGNNSFPIKSDIYIRKIDSDDSHPFKTVRQIGIEQLEFAIKNKVPIWLVMFDAGVYADFVLQEIKFYGLNYIAGIRITNNISVDGEERISAGTYMKNISEEDYNKFEIRGENYFLHSQEIYSRSIGKEKLLISYKESDKENIKIYTTNILNSPDEELMNLLLKRWDIEGFHRDAKQHLGLEDYQIRKFGAIQKVVRAVLVAYTQLALSRNQKILKPLKRSLETIGEGCRFFRLIAIKGWRWVKRKARNIEKLKEIMNSFVFVKNAKV